MTFIRIDKAKGNTYKLNLYYNKPRRGKNENIYGNIIVADPNNIAQILLDLELNGLPIEKALQVYQRRKSNRDWLGL